MNSSTGQNKQTHPATSTELFLRGTRQLGAGQFEQAKASFRENEEKTGTAGVTKGLLRQADEDLGNGLVADALRTYTQALDRNPSRPEAHLGLARIAFFSGQLDVAALHAEVATNLAPGQGLGWTLLGAVKEAQGDVEAALPLMVKGASLSSDAYLCRFNLGRLLTSLGRGDEATAHLTVATQLEPKSADAFSWLGLAQHQAGRPVPTLRALEQAKELQPKNPVRWEILADALLELRQFGAAAELMDRGLSELGEEPGLLERAATAAAMLSDAPRAITYLERELAVRPEREQAWLMLAGLSLTLGAPDRAEQALVTLLEQSPHQVEGWLMLGNLYDAAALEQDAVDAYQRAVDADPDDYRPRMNLATVYIESTNPAWHALAVPLLEVAQRLAPGEQRVSYNLALAFTRVGKTARALEVARRIQLEADPADPMVAEAKRLEANLLEAKR